MIPDRQITPTSQTASPLPTPDTDLVVKRFCAREACCGLITSAPYMSTGCCDARYHKECAEIMRREANQCPRCEKTLPPKFVADSDMVDEVAKYDWSELLPATTLEDDKNLATGTDNRQSTSDHAPSEMVDLPLTIQDLAALVLSPQAKATISPKDLPLDCQTMTGATERVLGITPCKLTVARESHEYINRMKEQGVIPDWENICSRGRPLPGEQCLLKDQHEAKAFFEKMQLHLAQLKEGRPFFYVFKAKTPAYQENLWESEYISRVIRICRAPASGVLTILQTLDEHHSSTLYSEGRLSPVAALSEKDAVAYLQFITYLSLSPEALFVRPTLSKDQRPKGLSDVHVQQFSAENPPKDLMPGNPTTSGLKLLSAIARTMGLIRIPSSKAKEILLLKPILDETTVRNETTHHAIIAAAIKDLGFLERHRATVEFLTPILAVPMSALLQGEIVLNTSDMMDEQQYMQSFVLFQKQSAAKLSQLAKYIDKGYITLKLKVEGGPAMPEEHLCIACDQGTFYLVNMSNPKVSVQYAQCFDDLSNYLQAFLGGRKGIELEITAFLQPEILKTVSAQEPVRE